LNYPKKYANLTVYILYGVIIVLASLSLLGLILTLCCDSPGCRHLNYFACFFLSLIAFIGLILAVAFSVFTPILTWGCDYLDYALIN
jgi:CDP-diglyceride synthetase